MDSLLPPPIAMDGRSRAFEQIAQRLKDIDLSALQVYDIDTVDSSALIHLAEQFNVLGLRGWNLALTDADRRLLLKEAIALHKRAGTPYAIRRSLALVGFGDAVVNENPIHYANGQTFVEDGSVSLADGQSDADGRLWDAFQIDLDPDVRDPSPEEVNLIIRLVMEWKNARTKLIGINILRLILPANGLPRLRANGVILADGSDVADGYTVFADGAQLAAGIYNPDGVPVP
ncbi:phage tail protein [Leptolyngbya sp. AN02str]